MNRARLALQTLEARDVPAFVAALDATGNATFTGNGSADLLVVSANGQGELVHNRFLAGDAGFVSAADFDSTQAGEQRFDNTGTLTRVRVVDTGRNDTFRFDTTQFQRVSDEALNFTIGAGGAGARLDLDADSFVRTGRNFAFEWDSSLTTVHLRTEGPNVTGDFVDVNAAPFAGQTLRIETGFGNDQVRIGAAAGSLDAVFGTIEVLMGGGNNDLLNIDDTDGLGGGRTYGVSAGSTTRQRAGLPPLLIRHEEGDIEQYTLSASNNADQIVIAGALILPGDIVGMDIRGNGGADTFHVAPDAQSPLAIRGGGPVVSPGDVLLLDLTGTSILAQGNTPDGALSFTLRASIGFTDIETVAVGGPVVLPNVDAAVPPVAPPPAPPAAVAAGGDLLAVAGAGTVRVFNGDGSLRFELPLGGFAGTPFVATGDVTGDGTDDVLVGLAAGNAPLVGLFDGATGALLLAGEVFERAFRGGVSVALGDLTGDGRAELLAGTASAGGRVRAFDLHGGGLLGEFVPLPGIGDGVALAAADLTGDGIAEVVVGAASGSSAVRAFDVTRAALAFELLAFGGAANGVSLGAGDLDGDGLAEVLVGSRSVGSRVQVLGATGAPRAEFDAFPGFAGGVSVAAHDQNGDGRAEVLVGANGTGAVRAFGGDPLAELFTFAALPPGTGPSVVG